MVLDKFDDIILAANQLDRNDNYYNEIQSALIVFRKGQQALKDNV